MSIQVKPLADAAAGANDGSTGLGDAQPTADATTGAETVADVQPDIALFPDVVPTELPPVDVPDAAAAPDADVQTELDGDTGEKVDAGPEEATPEVVAADVAPDALPETEPDAAVEVAEVAETAPEVQAELPSAPDADVADEGPDLPPPPVDIADVKYPDDPGENAADADATLAAPDDGAPSPDLPQVGTDAEDTLSQPDDGIAYDEMPDTGKDADQPPQCQQSADCAVNGSPAVCHVWQCNAGKCAQAGVPDGQICDDGNKCSLAAACNEGACKQTKAKSCEDGNDCTADSCDPATGNCASKNSAAFCDDLNPCTDGDACKNGACTAGAAKNCTDNNACTQDSCDASTGLCLSAPLTATCDDGDACTKGEACANGKCAGGAAMDCKDGNPCTDDSCDAKTGCANLPNAATCADAAKCLLGACKAGACVAGSGNGCDDNNPCTKDTCDGAKGCLYAALSDGSECAKGDFCVAASTCTKGACNKGAAANCDDGNPCTDDLCDPAIGCKWVPNKVACSDGDACTSGDACSNGKCLSGKAVDPKTFCDDSNACTDDSCDKAKGCQHAAKAGACDDGNPCSLGEACANGSCTGGKLSNCDDGKQCTTDNCDQKTGDCSWTSKVGACDDGNACTFGDACQGATCLPGAATVCDDKEPCTVDACDPKTGCTAKPAAGADALACDGTVNGTACFKAFAANLNWTQAESACIAWGGHLARMDSAGENTTVRNVANTVCGANSTPFIGINDVTTEGKYVWADGTAVNYTNWQAGEPNNCVGCCSIANAGEDGGQMLAAGTWNDICVATALPCYVCRRPAPSVKCGDPAKCTAGGTCVASKCTGAFTSCDDGNSCTSDTCNAANQGCTFAQVADGTKCGAGTCSAGKCTPGVDMANPATSCSAVWMPGAATPADGLYWIDPDGKSGPVVAVQTACVFSVYGGGWALVAIAADDGQNTWTWNNRLYWTTDTTAFGSPAVPNKDFKSPLHHTLHFKDVLFVHAPSLVWAAYNGVGSGAQSFAAFITAVGPDPVCYTPAQGYKMSAGTLATGGQLCGTNLYFNMNDHDGNAVCGDDDQGWGPGWNTWNNSQCPFDDPGLGGSLGPLFSAPAVEQTNCGYGLVLGLNKGAAGTGANRMMVFVR